MSLGEAPHSGYCAQMAKSSKSATTSTPSPTRSRKVSIGGRIRAVRVPDDLWEEAQRVAKENGESLSEVIRRALDEYIKDNT